ncbi:MAG: dihydrodipicolinate reductase [Armatimonadetes bacterium]|nr:dihydrodipicolinate reductase [Armatimonadota bacterium]
MTGRANDDMRERWMLGMSERTRVCVVGLGPVGRRCAVMALERSELEIVAAADIDPAMQGRDLGDVLGTGKIGVEVSATLDEALKGSRKGVAVLCTTSSLERAADQIRACVQAGWHVVSTCEELAYPWNTAPQLSATIDAWASKASCSVLGTGVNPGFVMDALPAFLTGACQRVDTVLVERFQDASVRRLPFQQKIGAGLSLEVFEQQVIEGKIRHVGFQESIHMIAAALDVRIDKLQERVLPVIATRSLKSEFIEILPGMVAGVNQIAQGFSSGKAAVTLNLQAYFGHPQPQERVLIKGVPDVEMLIPGGLHGDVVTCAMTLNAVRKMGSARPGLRTMLDFGLPSGRFS